MLLKELLLSRLGMPFLPTMPLPLARQGLILMNPGITHWRTIVLPLVGAELPLKRLGILH